MSPNERGLTTTGRKAIWGHYYQRNKETGLKLSIDEDEVKSENEESEPRGIDMSDEDFVVADFGEQISPLIITFIPDEQFFILHLLLEPHEIVGTTVNTT